LGLTWVNVPVGEALKVPAGAAFRGEAGASARERTEEMRLVEIGLCLAF
jgi:hypothetical protein